MGAATIAAFGLAGAVSAQNVDFELINNSGSVLVQFFASPSTSSDWGSDVLGTQVVGSGESGIVTIGDGSSECVYDFRMVFDDASELTDQIDICALASYTIN
jgi:hypothetical protein